VMKELDARKLPSARVDRRMVDYVEITDELLPPEDPYWGLGEDPAGCWQGVPSGRPRYDVCADTFGAASEERASRDFPILEAYDDRLVLGRFYPEPDGSREVVPADASNAAALKRARCCFHHQTNFRVRGASQ